MDTQTTPPETTETPTDRRARLILIGVAAFVGVLVLGLATILAARWISPDDGWDVEAGQPVEVTIASGASARSIFTELEAAEVARASELARVADERAVSDRLQAGTYAFTTAMDPVAVIEALVAGSDLVAGSTFTVVEGWTIDRIVDELSAATGHTVGEYQQALLNGSVTSPWLDGSADVALESWEGLLFPAKYPIDEAASPAAILQPMAEEMVTRVGQVDWSPIEAAGYSQYDALIVASLVQREAGTDDERSTIASVIYNRLDQDIRLQIDATVIYALGYNPGRVLASHLETDSPYNTYRIDGLPPTPIGTVGVASLEAAADPAETEYLFYVLGFPDGAHLFAETYEGHQANIADARARGVLP